MGMREWWRNRRAEKTGNTLILPETEHVDDRALVTGSVDAARTDVTSGAYDLHMFSDENFAEMPYEQVVDDQLALTRIRLFKIARTTVLRHTQRLNRAQAHVDKLTARHDGVLRQIALKTEKLNEQLEILNGTRTGRAGLNWPGTPPNQTTLTSAYFRLLAPYAVFFVVGCVDLGVIFKSFQELFPSTFEAVLFTIPAVGVQIVFPHFIGDRINLLIHKSRHRLTLALELVVLFGVWLTFVGALAAIRMNFVLTFNSLNDAMYYATYAGFICMMLGLGLWLLLVAARHNPHEAAYARLDYAIGMLARSAEKVRQKIVIAKAGMPTLQAARDAADQGYRDTIESTEREMSELAKSVYRRSLVNLSRDVDFTSAYLTVTQTGAKERKDARNASPA